MPDPVTITGTGSSITPMEIPDGAQSVRIDLACTSGIFIVGAGDDLGRDRSGQCGGMNHFVLTLPDRDSTEISIRLVGTGQGDGDTEAFVATVAFSPEPKSVDPVVAHDCETLGDVYTAIADAEAGFAAGDLDAAGWADTVADGVTLLDNMIARPASPPMAPQAAAMREWLVTVSVPGDPIQGSEPVTVQHAEGLMGAVCADNGSIISITPRYGG